ncbi:uncharacterized protein MELLADRAFT_110156 [Melampsora larici-populina 98AG31]|uniref:Uncharacterized protein n=1 Tax=Melampsora larici-populina (strain 98AG31 / pathotype 3-4-7) TaxID=747676 RepID=F4RYV4_MELLP|nr:uncharacterized protein MELLADRAFT_110156 [Melampsora larici-populina 98AG31]EGG02314.1 hypothetical protein MELLADRAFT_110156 [Melampsora larici-populina 98AG31]
MVPNPNLDSPLCCFCGEDYPGQERTQVIWDPCQWSKDNPNKVNMMVPCLICSAQFEALKTQLCGQCKTFPKAVGLINPPQTPGPLIKLPGKIAVTSNTQFPILSSSRSSLPSSSHLSVPLNAATPSSAHYVMQVENSVQRAIAQAHELQSCQHQLQINNHQKPVVPYPPSSEDRAIERSKIKKGSESKTPKTTGFIKITIAYILDHELVETQLSGSTFEYDFSKPDRMRDLTKEDCNYFRDNH